MVGRADVLQEFRNSYVSKAKHRAYSETCLRGKELEVYLYFNGLTDDDITVHPEHWARMGINETNVNELLSSSTNALVECFFAENPGLFGSAKLEPNLLTNDQV